MNRYLLCFVLPWVCFIIIPYGSAFLVDREDVMTATIIIDVGAFVLFPVVSAVLWFITMPKQKVAV